MPRFITIGYGNEAGYESTRREIRDAAHEHDADLLKAGAVIGIAGEPLQVRNADAKGVKTETGAFMSAPLPIAGFALIEAADLNEAIDLASRSPCAVAHEVVEIWPLQDAT